MTFPFACPRCDRVMALPVAMAEYLAACPFCGARFTIEVRHFTSSSTNDLRMQPPSCFTQWIEPADDTVEERDAINKLLEGVEITL